MNEQNDTPQQTADKPAWNTPRLSVLATKHDILADQINPPNDGSLSPNFS